MERGHYSWSIYQTRPRSRLLSKRHSTRPQLASAYNNRVYAVRAVERMPPGEDRVKYDHLFGAGDPENKSFWAQSSAVSGDLANRYLAVRD